MLERELEKRCRKKLEAKGGMLLKWTCPGHRGVPDRIAILPGGTIIFIEFKSGSRLTTLQKWWIDRLNAAGCRALVVNNEEEFDAACAIPD